MPRARHIAEPAETETETETEIPAGGEQASIPDEEPAAQSEVGAPSLFVAVTSAMGAVNVRRGEVAVEGAEILSTHGNLFKPLPITYKA